MVVTLQTVRSVFIIDPTHTIRLILMYPATCGLCVRSSACLYRSMSV